MIRVTTSVYSVPYVFENTSLNFSSLCIPDTVLKRARSRIMATTCRTALMLLPANFANLFCGIVTAAKSSTGHVTAGRHARRS